MSESGQAGGSGASAPTDLQQVLQLLMEDRHQREEITAEQRQREEEMERRLREMQQHIESLLLDGLYSQSPMTVMLHPVDKRLAVWMGYPAYSWSDVPCGWGASPVDGLLALWIGYSASV